MIISITNNPTASVLAGAAPNPAVSAGNINSFEQQLLSIIEQSLATMGLDQNQFQVEVQGTGGQAPVSSPAQRQILASSAPAAGSGSDAAQQPPGAAESQVSTTQAAQAGGDLPVSSGATSCASISTVYPPQISAGSQITILGSGFLTSSAPVSDPRIASNTYAGQLGLMGGNEITIGGYSSPLLRSLVSPDGKTLTATIPPDAFSWITKPTQATIEVNNIWGQSNFFNVTIMPPAAPSPYQPGTGQGNLNPTSGAPGTAVTVTAASPGAFSTTQPNTVYFEQAAADSRTGINQTVWSEGILSPDGNTLGFTVPGIASGLYKTYVVYPFNGQVVAAGGFAVTGYNWSPPVPSSPSYPSLSPQPIYQEAALLGSMPNPTCAV